MNSAHFVGNLTKDPVLSTTASGLSRCTFTVAVRRAHAESDGTRKADFIPVVCWRALAESCGKYLTKGRTVEVDAHIRTESYTDDQGVSRFIMSVVADHVGFLPGGARRDEANTAGNSEPNDNPPTIPVTADEEDLPF